VVVEHEASAGTVSKILWHFTGGPMWSKTAGRQQLRPKPARAAYKNLKSILRTRRLRTGSYREVTRAMLPEWRTYHEETGAYGRRKYTPVTLESVPVCCLADIPAPHLRYHAYRYGRFAIGFHRDAAIRHGFNPVLYTLVDTPIIESIYRVFSGVQYGSPAIIEQTALDIRCAARNLESKYDGIGLDLSAVSEAAAAIEEEAIDLETSVEGGLRNLVAFVKTFKADEFATIYCEREWRSTESFHFNLDAIAMIVLPKRVGKVKYFKNFVERVVPRLGLPRRVPVVPWDDLVEH